MKRRPRQKYNIRIPLTGPCLLSRSTGLQGSNFVMFFIKWLLSAAEISSAIKINYYNLFISKAKMATSNICSPCLIQLSNQISFRNRTERSLSPCTSCSGISHWDPPRDSLSSPVRGPPSDSPIPSKSISQQQKLPISRTSFSTMPMLSIILIRRNGISVEVETNWNYKLWGW